MAQQTINVGSAPDDSTGDPIRTAWTKANANFTELYTGLLEPPQGRLTLATVTPVMTSTVLGATTIYYTPYVGNLVPIYDGSNMNTTAFSELSVALSDTTKSPAAVGALKVNDWFVWNDTGTIRLSHGPDWTDDMTRSTGTALARINGIWLNNVAITNGPGVQCGTYVGTTRSNASSQLDWIYGTSATGGGAAWFGVWNCYNRVQVATMVMEATANWTAAAATIRPFNNSTNNRASAVFGLSEDAVITSANSMAVSPNGYAHILIGYNSTSAFSGTRSGQHSGSGTAWFPVFGKLSGISGLGFNFWQMLELGVDTATQFAGNYTTINSIAGLEFNARM